MKQMVLALLMLLGVFACVPTAQQDTAHQHEMGSTGSHLSAHYKDSLFKLSDSKYFSVELRFKDGSYSVGNNTVDLILHRDVAGNRDVENAKITITPWMPEHNHGVFSEPKIIERGAGLYTVENLEASMEGLWELRIAIEAFGRKDKVTFEIPDVKVARHAGHGGMHAANANMDMMSGMQAPEGTDFSTTRMSVRHLFQAGFEGRNVQTIPINRIHSWLLTLQDKEGNPVTGAEIKVDGDMPAHGHGMPTRPEVTREVKPGVYLVEGMKFSMPGYWTVTFYIKKGNETDAVTFNLMLR